MTLDAAEMQILDRLKRDNTHDGVRSVIESDFEPWFSLSERGLIAMEQHALGIIPHITRLGVRALTAALTSQAQTTGGVDAIEGAIARAFRRGFEWRGENPDSAAYLNKASADHADAAMTALKSGAPDA